MKNFEVDILRGENKIGENLIEVKCGGKRILLECGTALEQTEESVAIENNVLVTHYDGIIITHCHADHSGLLKYALNADAIFMGKTTSDILNYCNAIAEDNLPKIFYMHGGTEFYIGGVKVTPYLCDHSAYDSYMVELSFGGENLLYTGDFRSNGRKSFLGLLTRLPKSVDLLICEGTNMGRRHCNISEYDLEKRAASIMENHKKVFLLQSKLNIDRTVSFYRAAKSVRRQFIMTAAEANICRMLPNIPDPENYCDCFTYFAGGATTFHDALMTSFGRKVLKREAIAGKDEFVMQVNSNMQSYMQKLAQKSNLAESVLIYSMWEGYKENDTMNSFLALCESLGVAVETLHTSGHADVDTITHLTQTTHPQATIFVHKNNLTCGEIMSGWWKFLVKR